ncbi:hypothetical protein SEVIR_9G442300v4 [Setaria viridis]|uniref:Uncharacterized protein n=1 Tax=Setaria viridis TaxID=4556 RepID=A0A4U6T7B9_SETVI|nr:uncharacterized PE-PGRS family protein PE_PGRS54-like [Setaria viridis]TKV96644.1 hypothetical protein SEVIR_9G442300v2 [Setaria viridis]
MEDSVGEEERREQGKTVAQPKAHQEEAAAAGAGGGGGGEPAQDGGFLSAMASKINATMSGTNGSGGEANAAAASDGQALKRDGSGEPGDEDGFLSAMASKIGAAMSGADGGGESNGGGNAARAADDEGREQDEGNGGGGIFHKLLSSSPPASSSASGTLEAEAAKGEEKDQGVADEQAGILSAMASKIGMAMSAANGNGNHGTEDASKTSNGHAADSNGDEKGGDANGGGILNTMASKIGMAMSGANGDDDHGGSGVNAKTGSSDAVDGSKDEEKRDEANGGGILSAVASKIGMTVSGSNGNGNHSTEDDAKTSNGEEEKEKGHNANGAGIVEQIISNLPSDDQAPDSDEASLLIAIIED